MSAAVIDFRTRAQAGPTERSRLTTTYREMLAEPLEEFEIAVAGGDLSTARDALAAFIAFDLPEGTPLEALEWRGEQIRTLAEKLCATECAPKRTL
ncbi:hypothetical protein OGR47_12070 [Methylocystis sp. MJC1]|uniref:hypothetical protein n=1 Tax=Methylocystis sp. MJC1 TaxID=2654282 RepID=UPI0013EACD2E|nr:hypothetical protein [Methylocystis sp. MJC1]KAF2990820.1 hypothetical protein MJC1_01917 [Methylocystis sp. MJC1]MBU6527715.1 hypothetical protein [Methylocystis sp. MJC1]UZX10651.1 hypothetical protein OGR47_12070 [Methylocystis sp. MJC1]